MNINPYIFVAIGGALGASARYFVVQFYAKHFLSKFHLATLTVNTLGSFVMLLFMGLFISKVPIPLSFRLFFGAGFLGAFTTFSTFSYETLHLFKEGFFWQGVINILLNNIFSLAAGIGGLYLSKIISEF